MCKGREAGTSLGHLRYRNEASVTEPVARNEDKIRVWQGLLCAHGRSLHFIPSATGSHSWVFKRRVVGSVCGFKPRLWGLKGECVEAPGWNRKGQKEAGRGLAWPGALMEVGRLRWV